VTSTDYRPISFVDNSPGLVRVFAAVALALLLLLGVGAARASSVRELRLPLDDRQLAAALLSGFHEPERDARGAFRWTTGDARAAIALPGVGAATELRLALGPGLPGFAPGSFELGLGARPPLRIALSAAPRVYRLLVPSGAATLGSLPLALRSPTITLPPDTRPLGVRVEAVAVRSLGDGVLWPSPALLLLQGVALALLGLIALRLGAPVGAVLAVVVVAAALLALPPLRYPLVAPVYLMRLVVALALLAGLTAALGAHEGAPLRVSAHAGAPLRVSAHEGAPLRVSAHEGAPLRVYWAITLLACLIRLAGALFPPFAAYDLGLNLGRLSATVGGALVAANESFEFGGGLTVYPSGPYLVLMPGMLAGLTPKLAVQGGIALLDGLATMGVAALGLALGMPRRPLIFACLAYAALPIGLTTLYYGHTAQAFGQALMAPLAAALLLGLRGRGGPWPWLCAWALLSAALLSHIGVSILALAWLGLAWLALTLTRRLDGPTWRRLSLTLLLGGLTGLALVYGPFVASHLSIVTGLEFGGEGVAPAPAYNLIAKAWWLAFTPLGLLLAVAGLPLLRGVQMPLGAAELLGAWLGAVVLFWGVEMLTGLQVRYLVFLAPLACLLAGLSLAWLAERRAVGPWLAWGLALALLAQGLWVWLPGAFERVAPSMVPLLR